MNASTKRPDDLEGRKFPPIGFCIYCGSDGGTEGLRDEHVVPFSLGGNAVLTKASCRQCEAVTSYLDGYLARSIYYDYRLQAGVQSRRKQPTKRTALIAFGSERKTVEFDIKDHPHFLNLPIWGRPGLMYAEQPTREFKEYQVATFYGASNETLSQLKLHKDRNVEVVNEYSINLETFSRAIAKIAYCSLIATIGLKNFRPLYTPAIILGRYPYPSHFVGCQSNVDVPPADRHKRHMIEYGVYEHGRLLLAHLSIRLFSDSGSQDGHGMPIYEVLVGAPRVAALPVLLGQSKPVLP